MGKGWDDSENLLWKEYQMAKDMEKPGTADASFQKRTQRAGAFQENVDN